MVFTCLVHAFDNIQQRSLHWRNLDYIRLTYLFGNLLYDCIFSLHYYFCWPVLIQYSSDLMHIINPIFLFFVKLLNIEMIGLNINADYPTFLFFTVNGKHNSLTKLFGLIVQKYARGYDLGDLSFNQPMLFFVS